MSDVLEKIKTGTYFWDDTLPDNLVTHDGFKAYFGTSFGGTQTNMNRRPCKSSVEIQYSDGSSEEFDLGSFLIETIQTDAETGTATINLTSLIQPMMEADASTVKDGQSWYQNRHVGFLVYELLKSVYVDKETGQLPDNFIISTSDMKTSDDSYTFSTFGRPPEYDGRAFLELGLTCRAMARGDVGDGASYIYLGCDNEIWRYDPAIDIYTRCCAINDPHYQVTQFFVSGGILYGVGIMPVFDTLDNNTFPLTGRLLMFKYTAGILTEVAEKMNVWVGDWQFRRGSCKSVAHSWQNVPDGTVQYKDGSIIGNGVFASDKEDLDTPIYTFATAGENIPVPVASKVIIGISNKAGESPLYSPNAPNNSKFMVCSPTAYMGSTAAYLGQQVVKGWSVAVQGAPLYWYGQLGGIHIYDAADPTTTTSNTTLVADGPGYISASATQNFLKTGGDGTWPRVFARHAFGNQPTVSFFSKFGSTHDHISVLFFKLDNADPRGGFDLFSLNTRQNGFTPQITLSVFDFSNSTYYDLSTNIQDNSLPLQPTTLFVDNSGYGASDYEIYFTGVAWDEAINTSNISYSCMRAYKMAAGGTTLGTSSVTSSRSTKTVVAGHVNRNHSGKEVQLCYFKRDECLAVAPFRISYTPKSSPNITTMTDLISAPYMFDRFVVGSDNKTYFLNLRDKHSTGGQCQLWTYDGSQFVVLDDNRSTVPGESNQASNLLVTTNKDNNIAIYGVSAPYFSTNIQKLKITGKYWMWKYDNYMSNRIELADFTDLKVWDALTLIANANRSYVGFDLDYFIFVPRSYETAPVLVIDADNDPFVSLQKVQDKDVKNVIRAVPYSSKIGDLEYNITLKNKEGDTPLPNTWSGDLGITQKDTLTKSILLRCAKSGVIDWTDSKCRFGYLIHEPIMEVKNIREIGAADTYIYLADIFDSIKFGDYLVISNPTTKVEVYRRVTDISSDYKYVGITAALGFYVPPLVTITILPVTSLTNSSANPKTTRFSDEGVSYVTDVGYWVANVTSIDFYCHSIRAMGKNTILTFGDKNKDYVILDLNEQGPNGTNYVIVAPAAGGFVGSTDIVNGDVIRAYFKPNIAYYYKEIANTNIEIAFYPQSTDPTTSYFNSEYQDTIEITCPGLSLIGDEQSKYSAVDTDSISRFGKREYSIPDNRFIHHAIAAEWVRGELTASSNPRLMIDLTVNLTGRYLGITSSGFEKVPFVNRTSKKLNIVRVINRGLFKNWPGYYADCYLTGQSFNPKTFQQKFSLRSVLPF